MALTAPSLFKPHNLALVLPLAPLLGHRSLDTCPITYHFRTCTRFKKISVITRLVRHSFDMQRAATARNGRDYLLQELLPTIQDDKTWEMITRDLLEQRDRSHIWRLDVQARFAELTDDELDDDCYEWTLAGTRWLQQIALDIRFATSLFKPDEWEPHILEDFLNSLAFTLKLFQGQQECLGKMKKHCQNLENSNQAVVGDRQVVAWEFDQWRTFVNDNLRRLVGSLNYNEHKKWDKHN